MIDARGRSCPEPVIMIKKAMETKETEYTMMVDNRTSLENVTRYAQHNGYEVSFEEKDEDYLLKISKSR